MLGFEGEGKAIDDAPKDLQQLCNAVEFLSLVDESACFRIGHYSVLLILPNYTGRKTEIDTEGGGGVRIIPSPPF